MNNTTAIIFLFLCIAFVNSQNNPNKDCREYELSLCRLPFIHYYCKRLWNGSVVEDRSCSVCASRNTTVGRNCRLETAYKQYCKSSSDCVTGEKKLENVICCKDDCLRGHPLGEKICLDIDLN